MTRLLVLLAIALSALLVACDRPAETKQGVSVGKSEPLILPAPAPALGGTAAERPRGAPAPLPAPAPPGAPASRAFAATGAGDTSVATVDLQAAERKVISTASVSLQVGDVARAVTQVRAIAEGLGGFVEQLSSSGGQERQQATVTLRVPQPQFFTALERIEGLGEVQNRNVSSEDVSERFIDLEARLKSAQRQEQSLLSLLQKAQNVGEILTIERELTRIRSEIERLQGQLNFLTRRVELATIVVSLSPPREKVGQPPSANLSIAVSDVRGSVEKVKARVSSLNGTVDKVFLSQREGRESAGMSLRVFARDFNEALTFVEGQGKVQTKDVQEGTGPAKGAAQPKEPDARIEISFDEQRGPHTGLIVAILAVALSGLLGLLFLAYRVGRRRARHG